MIALSSVAQPLRNLRRTRLPRNFPFRLLDDAREPRLGAHGSQLYARHMATRLAAAPYMDLQPKDMKLQMFGDFAIATFHLDDRTGFLNRRTIVLAKTKAGWKIVHQHASEVSETSAQR
jgi:ketosteroid isomerase-like protein